MEHLISCEFNMDTACVELIFANGSMIAIDTIAVENEVADNMYQRSELDWLIYNKPLEYAQLVLEGNGICSKCCGTSVDRLRMAHYIQRVNSRWMLTLTRIRVIMTAGGVLYVSNGTLRRNSFDRVQE